MRAARTGAAGFWSLIIVVAIGAIHQARGRPRRDETRHIWISPGRFHRMKGLIRRTDLNALVRLGCLTRHARRAAIDAVRVTTETQFVFMHGFVDYRAARTDSSDAGNRSG